MKNNFMIQFSINEIILKRYVEALKKIGANYSFFSIYNDSDIIDNLPGDFTHNNYITIGSVKSLRLIENLSLDNFENKELYHNHSDTYKNSFFYKNKNNFDQKYYKDFDLPLLNGNSDFFLLKEGLNKVFKQDMFIKPSNDMKAYLAGILPKGVSLGEFMAKNLELVPELLNEPSLLAEVKDIHSEYRFFVVNDNVMSYSRYMLNKEISVSTEVPFEVREKANELAKKYQPDQVYTMDLALLKNGDIQIVEYNCFNVSGVYLAKLEELLIEISNLSLKSNIKLKC